MINPTFCSSPMTSGTRCASAKAMFSMLVPGSRPALLTLPTPSAALPTMPTAKLATQPLSPPTVPLSPPTPIVLLQPQSHGSAQLAQGPQSFISNHCQRCRPCCALCAHCCTRPRPIHGCSGQHLHPPPPVRPTHPRYSSSVHLNCCPGCCRSCSHTCRHHGHTQLDDGFTAAATVSTGCSGPLQPYPCQLGNELLVLHAHDPRCGWRHPCRAP